MIREKTRMLFKVIIYHSLLTLINAACDLSSSFPWQPDWTLQRDDLYCTSACQHYKNQIFPNATYSEKDKCCTCNSCTDWEGQLTDLYVEYYSVLGKTIILYDDPFDNTTNYQVYYSEGEMTELPSNLCDWDSNFTANNSFIYYFDELRPFWNNIFELDFTGNKIRKLDNLNCLTRLDTLILKNNRIQHVSNTSLSELAYLRILDLSANEITTIDPSFLLNAPSLHPFYTDFSYNQLVTLEVSNIMLSSPFCKVNYSHNVIESLVNTIGISLDYDQNYGPGFVSFQHNVFETFPDLKNLLNLNQLADWGKFIHSGFDFRGINLICDCTFEPFLTLAEHLRQTLFQDYFNVTCVGPDGFEGRSVLDLAPVELTCELGLDVSCPRGCTCVDQPHYDTLYINCSNANLYTFPPVLPVSTFSSKVSLDVSANHITEINNTLPYFSKLSYLNIASNRLSRISNEIAAQLENVTLHISDNYKLRELPQIFQYRNLCSLYTENLEIDCTCDTLWMASWIQTKHRDCNNHRYFECVVPEKGRMPALDFRRSLLQCEPDDTGLRAILISTLILLFTLIIGGILVALFRYELLVMFLRIRQQSINTPIASFQYDVFVVINKEDEKLRVWVIKELRPTLLDKGYRVFLPIIDVGFGDVKENEVALAMKKSRSALFILTENYLEEMEENNTMKNEWKYAWHSMKSDRKKNVVIVNYDHVSSFDIFHPQVKAYLRIGHTVQFGNHDFNVFTRILTKLGPPPYPRIAMETYDKNARAKFTQQNINKDTEEMHELAVFPDTGISDHVGKSKFDKRNLYMVKNSPAADRKQITISVPSLSQSVSDMSLTCDSEVDLDTKPPKGNNTSRANSTPKTDRPHIKKITNSKVKPHDIFGEVVSLKSCQEIETMFIA